MFWSSHDQLSFSTSRFDISETTTAIDDIPRNIDGILLDNDDANVNVEIPSINTPSNLYDRELYMTKIFSPEQVIRPGESIPQNLRSKKRCLFLPQVTQILENILLDMNSAFFRKSTGHECCLKEYS